MSTVFLICIAIMGGIAIALQGQFMGLLDHALGTLASVFVTYAGGGLIIALILIAFRGGNLKNWQGVPWYAFGTGILGLVVSQSSPHMTYRDDGQVAVLFVKLENIGCRQKVANQVFVR